MKPRFVEYCLGFQGYPQWKPAVLLTGPPYAGLRVLLRQGELTQDIMNRHYEWSAGAILNWAGQDIEVIGAKEGNHMGEWRESE